MYNYLTERPNIFTEEGIGILLSIRDKIQNLCKASGATRMSNAMGAGDSWMQLACVDYLIERGDIHRVTPEIKSGQDQVFVWIRQ